MHSLQDSTADSDPLWPHGDLSSYRHQSVATVEVVKNYSKLSLQKHLFGRCQATYHICGHLHIFCYM